MPAELLTDFTPVDENQLDFGTVLVPGVNACDPNQYKDLDFVGFCELSPFYEEEHPFILLDDFCQQVRSGEIANVEHYCPRLEAGDAHTVGGSDQSQVRAGREPTGQGT